MNNNLVKCSNCGTDNAVGTSFCSGCGSQIQMVSVNQKTTNNPSGSMNYFKYIIGSILKPHSEYKKSEKELENIKNSAILSGIVVVAIVVINLITTMFNAVRVTSFWTDEVEWVWENLKEIPYFKVIGQSLLIYAGILAAIAGIYFLASLIIKKDVKFPKLLGIVATAFLPIVACVSILSPILSLIYAPLGMAVSIIGIIYGVAILIELINDAIVIDNKDTKIYFHLICLSILIIGMVVIVYNVFLNSLGSLSSLSSILG